MKVSINAGGRLIEVEAEHGEPATLVFLAKNLWFDTKPADEPAKPEPSPGPAATLATQKDASAIRAIGHGRYGYGFRETNA